MKICLLLLAILSISSLGLAEEAKATGTTYEKEGEILILNKDNFDQAIQEHKAIFVKFYTDWCPHCKKLKPKWKKLANHLKKVTMLKLL